MIAGQPAATSMKSSAGAASTQRRTCTASASFIFGVEVSTSNIFAVEDIVVRRRQTGRRRLVEHERKVELFGFDRSHARRLV